MSEQKVNADIIERAKRIRLILMDCDGVLTDGRLYYSDKGEELKVFHVHDGQGLVNWHRAGFSSGIITGRESKIVNLRADELGIRYLRQGVTNKVGAYSEILEEGGFSAADTAFIGDDLADIELLERVGFSAAVADAAAEVLPVVHYITDSAGGVGAVREVVDLLLASKRKL